MLAQRQRALSERRQEGERGPSAARIEQDEEAASPPEQAGVRRQPSHVRGRDLDAHESEPGPGLDGRPLAEREQQRGEDHGRPFVLSRERQQPVDTVTHAVVRRRRVDEMRDEREKRRQPRETVARGDLRDEGAREGGDVGIAREGEGEFVEDRTRVLGLGGRRAQRGFSSNSSRLMISASSLSFRVFA